MLMFRPLMRYADFKGRARRSEYWLFALFQGFLIGLCLFMAGASLGQSDPGRAAGGFLMWLGICGIVTLALIVPYYAVLTRRLHDTGRSAWWMLLLAPGALAPSVMMGSMGAFGSADPKAIEAAVLGALTGASLFALIAGVCNLVLFVLTLLPGTNGPNRFGSDPRDPSGRFRHLEAGPDEARLDALIETAIREKRDTEAPYKPVFDFGPSMPTPDPAPVAPRAAWNPRPAYQPGGGPAPVFGKRVS